MPFAGKCQLSPEDAMCAKIPVTNGETDTATAMSYGFIPKLSEWSPFHGAAFAVAESLAKLAAVGADPFSARLTMQEYFERLYDKPERWGKPAAALLGGLTAQLRLNVPSIGGKDSMSGSFNDLDVPPTLVCFALAVTKASKTVSSSFKKSGSKVVLLPLPIDGDTLLPDWEKTKKLFTKVYEMVSDGRILSASVVREGGSAAAVCRMAFGDKFGFRFENSLDGETLFAPLCASFVAEISDDADLSGLDAVLLGKTADDGIFIVDGKKIFADELIDIWTSPLEEVFPTHVGAKPKMIPEVPLYEKRNISSPSIKSAKPRVFIPAFPGTNCEVDSALAFRRAGAEPEILVAKNLTPHDIEETIENMVRIINNSQIIMIPGGFSGGDEPDGSGKFIATMFRNAKVKEAVTNLLEKRDGLMLGICNGFQALIKLGLVPYGKIIDIEENCPTLTFNTIGRHISRMVYTRVTSVKSPWLSGVNAGDVFTIPISHGEGRFVADDKVMEKLAANGQIATQYVDLDGNPSADIEFNPNGSVCAVEGITSPDGRVFGKMAHSERRGNNLYKNVPGEKNQLVFESGVKYFK